MGSLIRAKCSRCQQRVPRLAFNKDTWICLDCGAKLERRKLNKNAWFIMTWGAAVITMFAVALALTLILQRKFKPLVYILAGMFVGIIVESVITYVFLPFINRYSLADDGVYCCVCSYPLKGGRGMCSECGAQPIYWQK